MLKKERREREASHMWWGMVRPLGRACCAPLIDMGTVHFTQNIWIFSTGCWSLFFSTNLGIHPSSLLIWNAGQPPYLVFFIVFLSHHVGILLHWSAALFLVSHISFLFEFFPLPTNMLVSSSQKETAFLQIFSYLSKCPVFHHSWNFKAINLICWFTSSLSLVFNLSPSLESFAV